MPRVVALSKALSRAFSKTLSKQTLAVVTVLASSVIATQTAWAQGQFEPKLKRPLAECYHGCLKDRYRHCYDELWGMQDDNVCRRERLDCLNQCGVHDRTRNLPD